MKLKRFWAVCLTFWTLVLALWTGSCKNGSFAGAAEGPGVFLPDLAGAPETATVPGQNVEDAAMLDVPFIDQRENWPTGCESVSAVMALTYAGVAVTVDEFIDGYLPRGDAPHEDETGQMVGCDPRLAFPGDPRTEDGWGCFVPAILNAVEALLGDRGSDLIAKDLTGSTLDELCEAYVEQGVPVLLWGTIGMAEPCEDTLFRIEGTDEYYRWICPMHCLLLVGRGEAGFCFNDPMAGKQVWYSREAVERSYKAMGCQAAAIL